MARKERSLKSSVELEGVALHSGDSVRVRLAPLSAGSGIVFRRSDLSNSADIPALPDHLIASARRTVLRRDGSEVGMVEHLLSAATGAQVDNILVEENGPEMPGFDGSTQPYLDALHEGGIVDQKAERKVLALTEPIVVQEGNAQLVALPPMTDGLHVHYIPEYPEGIDATPVALFVTPESYAREVAPARTFVRAEDVDKLLAAGYGKGATAENTVVLGGDEPPQMRVEREPTRHKIADLIGDLSLVGADIHANLIATCSGHGLNQELARELRFLLEAEEIVSDEPASSGYDIRDIMRVLPHRYPFLLVDRVLEVEGVRRAVGLKNVSINEEFFQGHWPDNPIMPGVLQLEAMAQLAGLLLVRKLEHTGKYAVLASIDKVRFRGTVVPGDQLRIEVETLRLNRNRGQVVGVTKVGRRMAAEATLSFALIDA